MLALWLLETSIVTRKHRRELKHPMRLRSFDLH